MASSCSMADSGAAVDAVVVGAGFAGLLALHRLRAIGLSVLALEAGDGVGGTWYWNRYPGARCDVESFDYSYQFSEQLQQDWRWTERYASQPELLDYLNHVADRFDLRRDIRFSARVDSAHYDADRFEWTVRSGDGGCVRARWLLMASGSLSCPNTPDFPGQQEFAGRIYHTGRWPRDGVAFDGLRVGVIGTGSSGVQAIPHIAEQAAHLTVFQRTANYCIPAHNRPTDPAEERRGKADYERFRALSNAQPGGTQLNTNRVPALESDAAERERVYQERWALGGLHFQGAFGDLFTDTAANATASAFVRERIRQIVRDPAVAAALMPTYALGCKRLCADTGYYETFNRDTVTLVDVAAAPIVAITRTGLRTTAATYELDVIVLATGYDALTGALAAIDIRGRGGATLAEAWEGGPRTYLGLCAAGFPNMFIIGGAGSPAVLSNVVATLEQQIAWIADCIARQEREGTASFEASQAAQDAWVDTVNAVAARTIYPTCNSWYLGANVPGKTRVFMPYAGGLPPYRARCDEVAAAGYDGFVITAAAAASPHAGAPAA